MTSEQAVGFVLFSVAAAGTPGPSNLLLTATGAQVGVLRGLPCLFGVALGMAVMIFTVAFGLGSFILDHPDVLEGVRWIGAVVLCRLAWKVAMARHDGPEATGIRPVGLVGAAVFQWVNPKAWLVAASAAAAFLQASADGPLQQSAALAILFFLAAIPSCLPWLAFGAFLHHVLRSGRAVRTFNVAMGLLLAASVILILR
jgi:threonine/homoserine/homoserine lactone efflux protein